MCSLVQYHHVFSLQIHLLLCVMSNSYMLRPFYHIRQDVYENTWQLAYSAGSCHRPLFKHTCYVHLCPCNSSSNAVQLQLLQAATGPCLDKLLHPLQRSAPLLLIKHCFSHTSACTACGIISMVNR